jgi:rubrerythrin
MDDERYVKIDKKPEIFNHPSHCELRDGHCGFIFDDEDWCNFFRVNLKNKNNLYLKCDECKELWNRQNNPELYQVKVMIVDPTVRGGYRFIYPWECPVCKRSKEG